MKSKNTKKNSATKFGCDFCGRSFAKESTIDKHICEYKRRWGDKNLKGNRIGFNAWLNFYAQNTSSKKQKTYLDFTKSSYYLAFVKFGHYCVNVKCINISRYADWLLKNQIRIDKWTSDKNYTRFVTEYLREENPLDAIKDSFAIAIITEWDQFKNLPWNKYINFVKQPANIFDGRNIYDKEEMKKNGFDYFCIGINTMKDILKPELNSVN